MPNNPYELKNLEQLKKKATEWTRLTEQYPILWSIPSFDAYQEYKTKQTQAELPDLSPDDFDKYDAYREYFSIFPEGQKDEAEQKRKAFEYQQQEAEKEERLRKFQNQKVGQNSGILGAPIALVAAPFTLEERMQDDKIYKKTVKKIWEEWKKANPNQALNEKSFLITKDGIVYLNPEIISQIPNIHELAELEFRQKHRIRAWRYSRQKDESPPQDFSLDPDIQNVYKKIDLAQHQSYEEVVETFRRSNFFTAGGQLPDIAIMKQLLSEGLMLEFVEQNPEKAQKYASQNPLIQKALLKKYDSHEEDPLLKKIKDDASKAKQTELERRKKDPKQSREIGHEEELALQQQSERAGLANFVMMHPEKAAHYAQTNPQIKEALEVFKAEQQERARKEHAPKVSAEEALKQFQKNASSVTDLQIKSRMQEDFIARNPIIAKELAYTHPDIKKQYEKWRKSLSIIQPTAAIAEATSEQSTTHMEPAPVTENPELGEYSTPKQPTSEYSTEPEPPTQIPRFQPRIPTPTPPQPQQQNTGNSQGTRPRATRQRRRPGLNNTRQLASQAQRAAKVVGFLAANWQWLVPLLLFLLLIMIILLGLGGDDNTNPRPTVSKVTEQTVVQNPCGPRCGPTDGTLGASTSALFGQQVLQATDTREEITYTINVEYPGTATDIIVRDPIPPNATFVSASGKYTTEKETVGTPPLTKERIKTVIWSVRENQGGGGGNSCGVGSPTDPKWAKLNEYDTFFAAASKEFGTPANVLKAMAMIESGGQGHYNPDGSVISGCDQYGGGCAKGVMQVKPDIWGGLAKEIGANILEPQGNIRTSAKLMQNFTKETGSWQNAISQRYHPGVGQHGLHQNEYVRIIEEEHLPVLDAATSCKQTDTAGAPNTNNLGKTQAEPNTSDLSKEKNTPNTDNLGKSPGFTYKHENFSKYGFPEPQNPNPVKLEGETFDRWKTYSMSHAVKAANLVGIDIGFVGFWPFIENGYVTYMDNCGDGEYNPNSFCSAWGGNWQVGLGNHPSYMGVSHIKEAFEKMYGDATPATVKRVGLSVITGSKDQKKYAAGGYIPFTPIDTPSTFPDVSLDQITSGAKNGNSQSRTLLGLLMKDEAIGVYLIAKNYKGLTDTHGTSLAGVMNKWTGDGYYDPQKVINHIKAVYDAGVDGTPGTTGPGGSSFTPQTFTVTIRPHDPDTYFVSSRTTAEVIGGSREGSLPGNAPGVPGQYTFPTDASKVPGVATEMAAYPNGYAFGGHREHAGLDISAPEGSKLPIYAVADGTVASARASCYPPNDYSCRLDITHSGSDPFISSYSHIDATIRTGDIVKKGQQIGVVHFWGPGQNMDHLHFELLDKTRKSSLGSGWNINPRNYFPELQRWIPAGYGSTGAAVRAYTSSSGYPWADDGKEYGETYKNHPPCGGDCWAH